MANDRRVPAWRNILSAKTQGETCTVPSLITAAVDVPEA
jgi:hypothetical protein